MTSEAAAWTAPDIRTARRHGFVGAGLGWLLDGFETYIVVLVGNQVVRDLVGPNASPVYFGGILATTLLAWAVGGLVSGVLADYIGRKRTLMLSIVWYAVFAGLTALSPNYAVFILLRFLTGMGIGAEWGPGSALVSELWRDRTRGRGLALLQGAFGIGFILATVAWLFLNTGPGSWRWMFVLGIAPAFVALYVRRFVSDPELWVAADRRRKEARSRVKSAEHIDESDVALTRFTMVQVFKDAAMRKRTLVLLLLATVTLIGWWGTSTWLPAYTAPLIGPGQNAAQLVPIIALFYNLGGVAGYFAFGVFADFVGRKPTMFGYFIGALIMVPVLFLLAHSLTALAVLGFVNGFFTLGQFSWIALYPVENFPTYVRGTAMTVIFNLTRFIAAAGALTTGVLVAFFGGISTAAVLVGLVYIIGVVVAPFAGPETKGKPLPA
jgi:MFS family permease